MITRREQLMRMMLSNGRRYREQFVAGNNAALKWVLSDMTRARTLEEAPKWLTKDFQRGWNNAYRKAHLLIGNTDPGTVVMPSLPPPPLLRRPTLTLIVNESGG